MCLCPNMILYETNIYDVEKFGYSIFYASDMKSTTLKLMNIISVESSSM